jgi:hypothetical protein
MRERFAQFMVGRYGMDHFGRFLVYFSLALMIISLFFPKSVVYWLALAVLGYSYFRMFSRNTNSRYRENLKYLEYKNRVVAFWRSRNFGRSRTKQDPTKKIFKCPGCRQKVRVPRGKGAILITCPRCKTQFQKRT